MTRLQNKGALVTGAAGGIGRATAARFAQEGANVALLDINEGGLEKTLQGITADRGQAMAIPADVTSPEQVEQAIRMIVQNFGRLDIVFNGVGLSGRRWGDGPVDHCTLEAWSKVLEINLTSMFLVCKYAVPALLQSGGGSIINLSSVLGMVGGDEDFATVAYATSKGGIIAMSRAMASYYAPKGIRVNVIAPSLIATPMSTRAQNDPHILARLTQLQPLTGAFGSPDDVAAAAAYLASDDARFVTGVVLPVDGGWTVR